MKTTLKTRRNIFLCAIVCFGLAMAFSLVNVLGVLGDRLWIDICQWVAMFIGWVFLAFLIAATQAAARERKGDAS